LRKGRDRSLSSRVSGRRTFPARVELSFNHYDWGFSSSQCNIAFLSPKVTFIDLRFDSSPFRVDSIEVTFRDLQLLMRGAYQSVGPTL